MELMGIVYLIVGIGTGFGLGWFFKKSNPETTENNAETIQSC